MVNAVTLFAFPATAKLTIPISAGAVNRKGCALFHLFDGFFDGQYFSVIMI
jgi:hypothetical protein